MTDDCDVKTKQNVIANLKTDLCQIPSDKNTFILDGSKATLKIVSGKELFIQYSPRFVPSLFSRSNKVDVIPIENIISVRCKDSVRSSRISSSRNHLERRKISSYSGWLRLNQTLTTTPSPLRNKYINDLDYFGGGVLLVPPSLEISLDEGCGTQLVIDYVKKDINSKRWTRKSLCLRNPDRGVISSWRNALVQEISGVISDRPKNLLIFINPFGGKGYGKNIFYNKVVPLLRLSGVKYKVIITERPFHAKDMVQTCSLEGVDGVVCVGGDGMFSEIFSGLLLRAANQANGDLTELRRESGLRVGIIPAGINYYTCKPFSGFNNIHSC